MQNSKNAKKSNLILVDIVGNLKSLHAAKILRACVSKYVAHINVPMRQIERHFAYFSLRGLIVSALKGLLPRLWP